jgi:hypothetical protein
MKTGHRIVAVMLLLGPGIALAATAIADCTARSPDHSLALLELYTSEGCDSCPPADRWLSRFDQASAGDRVVPLAFHVDYWDRLGWKDRFASATFTERQQEEMRRQRSSFVYTPEVVLQGRDFPQWQAGDPSRAIAAINARPALARLELSAAFDVATVRTAIQVQVPNVRDRAHATLGVALVQNGLVSQVKAGENAGKRLAHDHVVRQWRVAPLMLDSAGMAQQQMIFSIPSEPGPLSVVAFAENAATGEVLQALALPLCVR